MALRVYDCMLDLLENSTEDRQADGLSFAIAKRRGKEQSDYFVSAVSKNRDEFIL